LIVLLHAYFLAAIVCLTLGFFSRTASVIVWIGHLSFVHRSYIAWYGVDAILSVLLLWLIIGPAGGAYSLDNVLRRYWRRREGLALASDPSSPPSGAANLAIRALQLHV
jgi:hypothetical protein